MSIPHAQLCLVSAQSIPNITPVLDPATRPRLLVMAVTPQFQEQSNHLAKLAQEVGVQTLRISLETAYDPRHIARQIEDYLGSAQLPGSIWLNATGGSKLMSLAATEVFQARGLPVFYVHPKADRLLWVSRDREDRDIANVLTLEQFMTLNGLRVVNRSQAPSRSLRDLSLELGGHFARYQHALQHLASLAQAANAEHRSPPVAARLRGKRSFLTLCRKMEAQRLLHWRGKRIQFNGHAGRSYVLGGWLEAYCYFTVQALARNKPRLHDLALGLVATRESNGETVGNELDVAFLWENRLHIIECKTGHWRGLHKAAHTTYKLDSVSDMLGGMEARAMLLSVKAYPRGTLARARSLDIEVVHDGQLEKLGSRLAAWL